MSAFLLSGLLQVAPPVRAQAPATSEESSATDSSKTTESLKQRIEKLVEEKREQIKGVLSDLNQERRSFIGQVQRVSEEAITIKNKKGTHIISLNQGVILQKKGKEIKVEDVAVDNWVVVMGVIEQDTFQPLKMLVSESTLRPAPQVVELGTITDISRNSLTLTSRKSQESVTITTTRSTQYQDLQGDEIEASVLTEEMQALVVGLEEDDEKVAAVIRVLTVVDNDKAN